VKGQRGKLAHSEVVRKLTTDLKNPRVLNESFFAGKSVQQINAFKKNLKELKETVDVTQARELDICLATIEKLNRPKQAMEKAPAPEPFKAPPKSVPLEGKKVEQPILKPIQAQPKIERRDDHDKLIAEFKEFKISGRIASAIQAGYRKAFSAIVDSNVTTIIAAVILIQFDSGPIKGFAVSLIIGIISSMFTALFVTRYFFAGWVQNPKHKSLSMGQFISNTNIDFLAKTKIAVIISLIIMVIGGYVFLQERKTIFGMDFTGGYSLTVNLEEKPGTPSYRLEAINALLSHETSPNDFQIRELSKPNHLRIQLGMSMEQKGHPFYQLPEQLTEGKFAYDYQRNPRIVWLVNALGDAGLHIQKSELTNLDKNWTVMSGQFSETMRNNALIGLGIALLSILIYITFRFEFKYALGAVVGLVHDVIITLGIFALFHKLGFPVQIDLQVVGAIMTIIGYSLNDTIIVFDRIREDIKIMRKMKFHDIVNHALNVTLSRTIMTSGTTLLVLLALVLLGGHSIFAFSLVMTIGVVVGTLSSLFIAAPVMIYFHDREEKQHEEAMALKKA